MPNTTKLPRLTVDGLDLLNAWVEVTVSAIERALNLQGAGGITVDLTATGATIKGIPGGDLWAYLAPGQTVSAASGLTLGTGLVTLCTRTPATGTLTATTQVVTVYNAGGGLAGGTVGYAIKLGVMRDGSYSVDVAPCAAAG